VRFGATYFHNDITNLIVNTFDPVSFAFNKFVTTVHGSADNAAKLAYAQAIDVAKLSKM
jgi:hypothetical protein